MNGWAQRWAPWAVAALAVILYLNILPNTFISDDWQQIFGNPFLKDPHGIRKIFATNVWGFQGMNSNYYRPLMHLSFLVTLNAFGFNPAGYHIFSVLMHALVSVLVYFLIERLSGDWRAGAVTALLFAAHPIHTETVCWISDYVDLENALCVLAAVWLYVRGARSWMTTAGISLCLFAGLLAKEIAIVIPIVTLAWDLINRKTPRWREYAGMGVALGAYLALRVWGLGALMPYVQSRALPLDEKLLTSTRLFFEYWWKLVWPAELNLFPYYPVSRSLAEWPVLAGVATLGLFAWLTWKLWRAGRPEFLGMVLFLGALAPAFTLPYGDTRLLAERYLYLSSLGFCWLLAGLLLRAGKQAPILLVVILAAYGARTWARNLDWRSEIPFYEKALLTSQHSADLNLTLGEAYLRRNMLPEALAATERAAKLRDEYPEAHNNLGQLHSRMGNPEKALAEYSQAAEFAREKNYAFAAARAYTNMGYELRRMGQSAEAIAAYNKALELQPGFAGARNNLGYALLLAGRGQEAEAELLRAIEIDPTLTQARSNLGLVYSLRGEWDRAIPLLDAQDAETMARLGEVMLGKGDRARAEELFRRALTLEPENERAVKGLARTSLKTER